MGTILGKHRRKQQNQKSPGLNVNSEIFSR